MGGSNGTNAARIGGLGTTPQQQMLENQANAANSGGLSDVMAKFGSGDMDYKSAMQAAQAEGDKSGAGGGAAALNTLATGPASGQAFASNQVANDKVLGKTFGEGGLQDQVQGKNGELGQNLGADREALSGKDDSYGLNQNDLQAYGQGSGNIARQFGQNEQSLSQSLADRGMGQGGNAATAQFSGMQGNKNEQLAGLQQNIVNNRIQTAQGLAQARTNMDMQRASQAASLGAQGEQAISNARGQNMGAAGQQHAQTQDTNQSALTGQGMQQSQNNIEFGQQQATKKKSFGEQLGDAATSGLAGSVGFATNLGEQAKTAGSLAKAMG